MPITSKEDVIKEKPPRGREMPTKPGDSGRICYEGYIGDVKYVVPDENLEYMKEDVNTQILTRGLAALSGEQTEPLAPSKYDRATRKLDLVVGRGADVLDPDASFTVCMEDMDENDIEDEKNISYVNVNKNKQDNDTGEKSKNQEIKQEKKMRKDDIEQEKKMKSQPKEKEKKRKSTDKEEEMDRTSLGKEMQRKTMEKEDGKPEKDTSTVPQRTEFPAKCLDKRKGSENYSERVSKEKEAPKANAFESIKVIGMERTGEENNYTNQEKGFPPKENIKAQEKNYLTKDLYKEEIKNKNQNVGSNKRLSQEKHTEKTRVSQDNVSDKIRLSGKGLEPKRISEENKQKNIRTSQDKKTMDREVEQGKIDRSQDKSSESEREKKNNKTKYSKSKVEENPHIIRGNQGKALENRNVDQEHGRKESESQKIEELVKDKRISERQDHKNNSIGVERETGDKIVKKERELENKRLSLEREYEEKITIHQNDQENQNQKNEIEMDMKYGKEPKPENPLERKVPVNQSVIQHEEQEQKHFSRDPDKLEYSLVKKVGNKISSQDQEPDEGDLNSRKGSEQNSKGKIIEKNKSMVQEKITENGMLERKNKNQGKEREDEKTSQERNLIEYSKVHDKLQNVCEEFDGEEEPKDTYRETMNQEVDKISARTNQEEIPEYIEVSEERGKVLRKDHNVRDKKEIYEEEVGDEEPSIRNENVMSQEKDKTKKFEYHESQERDIAKVKMIDVEIKENEDYGKYEESQGKEPIQEQKVSKEEETYEEYNRRNQLKEKLLESEQHKSEVKINSDEGKYEERRSNDNEDEIANEDYVTDNNFQMVTGNLEKNDYGLLNNEINVKEEGKKVPDHEKSELHEQSEKKSFVVSQFPSALLEPERLRLLISGHFRKDKNPIFIIQEYTEKTDLDLFKDEKVDFLSRRKLSERGIDAVIVGRFYDETILEESDGRPVALNTRPLKILIDQKTSNVYDDHFKEVYNLKSVEVLLTGEFLKSDITKRITPFLSLALRTGVVPENMSHGENQKGNTTTTIYNCQLEPSEPFAENMK